MPKPEWLKRREQGAERMQGPDPNMCVACEHIGAPVGYAKHKGKHKCVVYECAIHPGCRNTRYSIACDDWKRTSRPDRLDVEPPAFE